MIMSSHGVRWGYLTAFSMSPNMFSPTIIRYDNTCSLMSAMGEQNINLKQLKEGFKGKPFNQLIEYHLSKQKNPDKLRDAAIGTIQMLPESIHEFAIKFIDRWNEVAYDHLFWRRDTSDVFSEITTDAQSILSSYGISTDDEILFNMFQIVVLSYAYSASDQPKMREYIGANSAHSLEHK